MNDKSSSTVLVMAGGTGGHVFPGLAVAQQLIEQGVNVEWLGTEKGIESRVVPMNDIAIHYLPVSGIRGKGLMGAPKAVWNLLRAQFKAIQIIRQVKPVSVLGMGGFASGPGGLAAKLLGVSLYIHEQNAVAGTTNRILAKFATRVLQAFPTAFSQSTATTVGNPIRDDILKLGARLAVTPKQSTQEDRLKVLILGGSLGAKALNETVPNALALFDESKRPNIKHQTGEAHAADVEKFYNELNVDATVYAFVDNMSYVYEWADVVICRAGALTVSEISIVGLPAIYIPLPHAIDDHQTENAKVMATDQAGVLLPQSEMTAERLYELLNRFVMDREYLAQMSKKSQSKGLPFSSAKVAEICLENV
ncbi:MAG: undecaprenyldiphospho-muramoylpentapeptide beta-N-acetylglucosaminyltransferase [Pseudomonadota bacterium]